MESEPNRMLYMTSKAKFTSQHFSSLSPFGPNMTPTALTAHFVALTVLVQSPTH